MSGNSFDEILEQLAQESGAEGAIRSARDPDSAAESDMLEGVGAANALSSTPISRPAIDLLIAAEVSSRAFYQQRLTHPIWPQGQSGVTIGIGYDVGTVNPATLAQDWAGVLDQPVIAQLAQACGVMGPAASPLALRLQSVTVDYDRAEQVFLRRSVPEFVAKTERALPNTGVLSPDCLGALVSLAYNRGASFNAAGERFREMRAIRDHMADRAFHLVPGELRAMKRIWQGDPKMRGVVLRRESEALLFERGLAGIGPQAAAGTPMAAFADSPTEAPLEGLFSWVGGWLNPIIEEPTRDRLMFQMPGGPQGDAALIRQDEDYVAIRVLSARIVNARRWTSLYHGAVHATCSMLYEGAGSDRSERQSVLAPDGFRDIDPKGQGRLLQVDRPLFGPMPYRGDLRLAIALFSVKSSDLAGPYLSLISELSQTASLGFLSAAQPFVAPLRKAADLLFGTSDASSLECGTVRGFEPLRAGIWVCMGATRADIPDTGGFRLDPQDFRLLDANGRPVEAFPYMVFSIAKLAQRDNWMEIPGLKAGWDAITAALVAGRDDDAHAAARAFRRLCFAGGDLTPQDARRLADKANAKVEQTIGTPAAAGLEGVAPSLRSLDLYEGAGAPAEALGTVDLEGDAHLDPDAPPPDRIDEGLEALRPWRVAEALLALRRQVDARAPRRNKASDGAIGDAEHATRDSDHNPWVVDGAFGVVTAIDVTHDPAGGCDAGALAEAIQAARDPRVKYVIWNRQIVSATVRPWEWRPYTGANPHNKHVHISVSEHKGNYDSVAAWSI